MNKKNILFVLFLAFFGVARADIVEIGDGGTTNNTYLPGYNYYKYSLTQQIYLSEEIGTAGTIISIAFQNTGAEKTRTYNVYLLHTDKETFESGTDWVAMSDDDLVFSGELTFTVGEWTTIDFNTPFNYDGTSNLIVGVADVSGAYTSSPHMACLVFDATGQAIRAYRDASAYDIAAPGVTGAVLDVKNQIHLGIIPSGGSFCEKPSSLEAYYVTESQASLTWSGGSGTYNLQYKKTSDQNWTTAVANTHQFSRTISGLESNTPYQARVQSVCGSDVSGWKTVSFITKAEIPFLEEFGTSIPTGWTMYSGLLDDVLAGNAQITTSTSGWTFGTANGVFDNHARINLFSTSKKNWLVSPVLKMQNNVQLSFDMAFTSYSGTATNPSQTGVDDKFVVLVSTDDGSTWTILRQWDNTGSEFVLNDLTPVPTTVMIDLSDYAGQNVAVAFYGESTVSNADNNLHIDDVSVDYIPSCQRPINLLESQVTARTATIGWTSDANVWQLCLNGNESSPITVTSNPYTMTGLTPEITYTVKVRANCGGGDLSAWSREISFTTLPSCFAPNSFACTEVSKRSASFSWTSDASEWQLCLNDDENNLIYVTTNPYTLTGLTPETTYTAKLRANCGATDGVSAWSNGITFTTDEYCANPMGLTVSELMPTSAQVGWTSDNNSFQLRYRKKGSNEYGFEDGTLGDWTTIDADGDGYVWYPLLNSNTTNDLPGHYGSDGHVTSASYQGSALTPDNYLVSPQIAFGGSITFYACAQDASWAGEHFGVAVSTTGNTDAADFTTIIEWDMTSKAQGAWYQYTVDLSGYSGQGYVAIRHFNCTDMFRLNVDDITILQPSVTEPSWTTVTNASNPYIFSGLSPETTYIVQVRSNCGSDGFSDWVTTSFMTPGLCDPITQFQVGNVTSTTATLSWNGSQEMYNIRFRTPGNTEPAPDNLSWNFDDSNMGDWTTIDADGDGYNWVLGSACGGIYFTEGSSLANGGHNSSADLVTSGSYSNFTGGALTPDNYLVSPQISLGSTISFWACAQDGRYAAEHFGVAVSTTNNTDASAFTTIQEWTLTAKGVGAKMNPSLTRSGNRSQGNWYEFTVDLTGYSGQGYVAIRHFDCTDLFMLNVDDISYGEMITTPASNWQTYSNVTSPFILEGLNPNTAYEVQVQGNCPNNAVTEWTNMVSFKTTAPCALAPALNEENITATFAVFSWVEQDVATTWEVVYGSWDELVDENNYLIEEAFDALVPIVVEGTPAITLEGLTPETIYLVFVRSVCSGGYTSVWLDAYKVFTTLAIPEEFEITVMANPNYGGTVSGGDTYQENTTCTVIAAPNEGWAFVNWTENDTVVSTEETYSFKVTGARTLVANFEMEAAENYYTPQGEGFEDNMTLTGVIQIDGVEQTSTALEVGAFCNGQCRGTVRPVFFPATQRYLALITIFGENGDALTFKLYDHEQNAELDLVSPQGIVFGSSSIGSLMDPCVLNFTHPVVEYSIGVSANPAAGGTVSGAGTYQEGQSCTLTATPNAGYTFVRWTKNGSQVSTNPSYTFTVTADASYVAEFSLNSYGITVTASPAEGGTVTGVGNYSYGSSVTLTATPNAGYTFVRWTRNGTQVSTNPNYTFTVSGAASYVAVFSLNSYAITVSANPSDGGTVSGAGTYYHGANCSLNATANEGYAFVNWTENGTAVSTANPYSFTVTGARTLVAQFEVVQGDEDHWIPQGEGFEDNMTLTGVIQIDGVEQTTTALELGAFCNGQCRGTVRPIFFPATQRYLALITIFGVNGDALTFKLYDHDQETELDLVSPQGIVFGSSSIGSLMDPYVLNFTTNGSSEIATFTRTLDPGWNWFSCNLEFDGDMLEELKAAIASVCSTAMIKTQNNGFINYASGRWSGSITQLGNEMMLLICVDQEVNFTVEGMTADPLQHPVTLTPGWNWIGYVEQGTMSLSAAFANFSPENGDMVKCMNSFSIYNATSGTWSGNLKNLEPGNGYVYLSNRSGNVEFVYPNANGKGVGKIFGKK